MLPSESALLRRSSPRPTASSASPSDRRGRGDGKAGEGIANQRKAIALGIKDSLEIIQETGVGNDEANQLFMFTQWSEMMTEFARTGKTSTVVLPSDFSQSARCSSRC